MRFIHRPIIDGMIEPRTSAAHPSPSAPGKDRCMPSKTKAVRPLTDAEIRARTGKTWDDWFKTLDKFGGVEKGRREIGYTLHGKPGVDAWLSATIIVEYEAARGVLEPDGRPKGYMVCPTKTIAAPVDAAYRAW